MLVSSPRADLCDPLDTESAFSAFDSSTGQLQFRTNDPAAYPNGVYSFEITANVGSGPTATAVSTFELALVDPCLTAQLSLTKPFQDVTYFFLEPDIINEYDV